MSKIPERAQDPVVKWLMDTHPKFRTTKRINLLRLREPKKFLYENKPRLNEEVTEDLIEVFNELNSYFYLIPVKNRMRVLQSTGFNRFVTEEWLVTLQANDIQIAELKKTKEKTKSKETKTKKTKSKKDKDEYDVNQALSYQNYQNLFNIGLEGLIKSMPEEFQNYISNELKPMFKLMQSISRFTGSKVPYVHYPDMFNDSTIDNASSL